MLAQDIDAAVEALNEEDFENLNIFANRIMSNAILGDERKFALPGFFLKDIYVLLGSLKVKTATAPFSSIMSLAKGYAKRLQEETTEDAFTEGDLWSEYYKLLESLRHFTLTEAEEKAYKDSPVFTHDAFQWLISYLGNNKDTLLHSKNQLLRGINNEMSRLYRCHGGEISELYAISLVTALGRCDDYVKIIARDSAEYEKLTKEMTLPLTERLIAVLKSNPPVSQDVNELLWELIKQWRQFFLKYMETRRASIELVSEPEKGIELPEETRKKLTSAITKSLEGELKLKK